MIQSFNGGSGTITPDCGLMEISEDPPCPLPKGVVITLLEKVG